MPKDFCGNLPPPPPPEVVVVVIGVVFVGVGVESHSLVVVGVVGSVVTKVVCSPVVDVGDCVVVEVVVESIQVVVLVVVSDVVVDGPSDYQIESFLLKNIVDFGNEPHK